MAVKLSLIVSTYNRPDALKLVLEGIRRQQLDSLAPESIEVLIADDGSTDETRLLVQSYIGSFPFALRHIWHEDAGFRLAAIRNLSAIQARGDYLVFIDGDCVPERQFIRRHYDLAETGWTVSSGRTLLSEGFTRAVTAAGKADFVDWNALDWFRAYLRGEINKAFPLIQLPDGSLRKINSQNWKIFRGCNIGLWRKDYEQVNGFDEDFQGWGHEDSDLAVRLLRMGLRIKNGRFACILFHLWHRENDRSKQAENWQRFQTALQSGHIRARRGLDQYQSLA